MFRLAPKSILNMRKAARSPFKTLNSQVILESCTFTLSLLLNSHIFSGKTQDPIKILNVAKSLFGSRIPQRLVEFLALRTQQLQVAKANGASVKR